MSITNREEANKYYQLINGLVDEYVESHKIRPSKLRTYFKPNGERFQKFLKKNGLDNVRGANQVLNDVIDDRVSEELDGVRTFESFKYFESEEFKIKSMRECLYKAVEKSTLTQEKILADYFDTNLSSIDIVDSGKHHFKLQDWEGDIKHVVIYSEEEIDTIKTNFLDFFFEEVSGKKLEVGSFELELSKLIDKDGFYKEIDSKLTKSVTNDLIGQCIGSDWEFEAVSQDHHIWVKL